MMSLRVMASTSGLAVVAASPPAAAGLAASLYPATLAPTGGAGFSVRAERSRLSGLWHTVTSPETAFGRFMRFAARSAALGVGLTALNITPALVPGGYDVIMANMELARWTALSSVIVGAATSSLFRKVLGAGVLFAFFAQAPADYQFVVLGYLASHRVLMNRSRA